MKRGLTQMPFTGWNNASHLGLFLTSIHSSLVSSSASIIVDKNYMPEKYHFMHYKIDCVCDVEDALKSLMEYLDLKKLEEKKMFSLTFLHAFSDNKHIFLRIGCSLEKLLQISLTALIDATGLVHFFYIEGSAKNGTHCSKTQERQFSSLDVTNERVRSESTNSDDSYIDVVSNTDSSCLKQAELLKLSKLPSANDTDLNSSLSSVTSLIQLSQNSASNFNSNGSVPFKCLNGTVNNAAAVDYMHFQKDSAMSFNNNRAQHSSVKSKVRALPNHPISRQQFYTSQMNTQRGGRQQQPSILDKEFLEDKDYALANHFREQCARTACHFRSNANLYTKVDFSYRRGEYERLQKLVGFNSNDGSWCQRVSNDLDDTDEPIEMGKHHHLAFHDYCFASFKIAYCNKDKSKMKLCRPSQPVLPCRTALDNSHSVMDADLSDAACTSLKHSQQPSNEVNNCYSFSLDARPKHERKQQICPTNMAQTCATGTPDLHLKLQCNSLLKENCKSDASNPILSLGCERERRRSHTLAQNLSHNRNSKKLANNNQNHREDEPPTKCAPMSNPLCDLDLESVARRVVEEEARKTARDNNRAGDDFVYFGDALRSKRWRQRPSINSSDTSSALSSEWMPGIDSAYLEARAKMEQPLHPSQKKAFYAKFNVSGFVDDCVAPSSPIPTDVLIVGVSTQESRFLDDYLDVPNASVTNFLSTDDVTAFLGSAFVQDLDCDNDHTTDTDSHHELLLPDMLPSNLSPVPDRNGMSTSTSTSDSVHSFGSHDDKTFDTTLSSDKPASPADGRPEIITVSMFWNDLPGLMLDNQEFVRLVDIHKQVLPAKPTGLLKSRCLAMNLPFTSCTEIQRDFLIRYASADKSKSVLVVTKEVAKKLISYYVNPSKGTHSVASSNRSWASRKPTKGSGVLGGEHPYLKYSARQQRIHDKLICAEQKSAQSGRRPLKRKGSFRLSRDAETIDCCVDSPSSVSTQCTASTTDTSGYCSTEPSTGGGGVALISTSTGIAVNEAAISGCEEPRRKRYKVNKRSLDEIAKERRQLKKRQKQLRKQELDLMKNTIRQIYTPSKAGGYPRWRDSDTELVLLLSTEPPTRPHPPDMTAWERAAQVAGTTGSGCVGRRGRRGGNCIDLIHFDQTGEIPSATLSNVHGSAGTTNNASTSNNGGSITIKRSGSQQAGRFYFHLYLSRHAACVQCYSCDLYFNMEEFALHLHGSGGQLTAVNVAQRVELRSPYPSEMESRLWQRFVNIWRGYQTSGAPVAAPSGALTETLDVSPTTVSATTTQHVTQVVMSASDSHLCVDSRYITSPTHNT